MSSSSLYCGTPVNLTFLPDPLDTDGVDSFDSRSVSASSLSSIWTGLLFTCVFCLVTISLFVGLPNIVGFVIDAGNLASSSGDGCDGVGVEGCCCTGGEVDFSVYFLI